MNDKEILKYSELSKELTAKIDKKIKKDNGIYFTPPKTIYSNISLCYKVNLLYKNI